ncbi:MAG: serine hydrolase domain-containing protein [Thermodesulfobacteriota bacterium]
MPSKLSAMAQAPLVAQGALKTLEAISKKVSPLRKIHIPRDLDSVTTYDPEQEVPPESVGLTEKGVSAVWDRVRSLYRAGMHPAITLCIRKNGKVVLNRAIGHARGNGFEDGPDAEKVPATPDTLICWFSASKAITAMCIHLLAQQCKLHLQDPVAFYIPEFAKKGKKNVTIHQVLCHRGGFPMFPPKVNKETLFDYDAVVDILCQARHYSPLRRAAAYHAISGGFILGEIVKRITGKDIREYLEESFSKPLGLSTFTYGVPEKDRHRVATNSYTGFPVTFPATPFVRRALTVDWDEVVNVSNDARFYNAIVPAGNLFSTADEMCRYFQMLLNGGELDGVRIFEPLTVRRAVTEAYPREIDRILMLPIPYGAGMILGMDPAGLYGFYCGEAYGHAGFLNCLCWADPRKNISVALQNTGKVLLGPHLPALFRLVASISWNCS